MCQFSRNFTCCVWHIRIGSLLEQLLHLLKVSLLGCGEQGGLAKFVAFAVNALTVRRFAGRSRFIRGFLILKPKISIWAVNFYFGIQVTSKLLAKCLCFSRKSCFNNIENITIFRRTFLLLKNASPWSSLFTCIFF